jgi:hypothetical protein
MGFKRQPFGGDLTSSAISTGIFVHATLALNSVFPGREETSAPRQRQGKIIEEKRRLKIHNLAKIAW